MNKTMGSFALTRNAAQQINTRVCNDRTTRNVRNLDGKECTIYTILPIGSMIEKPKIYTSQQLGEGRRDIIIEYDNKLSCAVWLFCPLEKNTIKNSDVKNKDINKAQKFVKQGEYS